MSAKVSLRLQLRIANSWGAQNKFSESKGLVYLVPERDAKALDSRLYFEFLEVPINLSALILSTASETPDFRFLYHSIGPDTISSLVRSPPRKQEHGFDNPAINLARYGLALQYRTSYKKKHETVCLASLMGIDIEPLLGSPADNRMQIFLSLLKTVPRNVLFVSGPRLQSDRYRWAPASFMTRQPHFYSTLINSGKEFWSTRGRLRLTMLVSWLPSQR